MAIKKRNIDLVALLLQFGADINQATYVCHLINQKHYPNILYTIGRENSIALGHRTISLSNGFFLVTISHQSRNC